METAPLSDPSAHQNHRARGVSYADYIQSDWWRHRRWLAIRAARGQCQRCGSRQKIEVHHVSYERTFAERAEDLEVLCQPCHGAEHRRLLGKRPKRRRVPKAPKPVATGMLDDGGARVAEILAARAYLSRPRKKKAKRAR